MSRRGFQQTSEVFLREILANQNPDAISFPDEACLHVWWGRFYEAFNSRFPDVPVLAVESFDKVVQTVENVVANSGPANQSYASDHMGVDISTLMPVMPSTHLMVSSSPDPADPISDLMSRDVPSSLQADMNEINGMLPFERNAGYQMASVPPEWNARDDRPGINLGGPAQMELYNHAPPNALPASPVLSDAGYNRYLQQGWPSVGVGSVPPVISHEVEHPSVIVEQFLRTTSFPQQDNIANQTLDMLGHPAPASSGDFFRLFTQDDSSINILGDTSQRIPENLTADQQIIAPIGGIIRSSGKQPAVQSRKRKIPMSSQESEVSSIPSIISHQVVNPNAIVPTQKEQFLRTTSFPQQDNVAVQTLNMLELPAPASSGDFFHMFTQADSSGNRIPENLTADQQIIVPIGGIIRSPEKQPAVQSRKRKPPMSSRESVGKERATDAGFAAPARTQAERRGISFKEIHHLHTKSKLLCCHFNSQGELLAAAGHDRKVHIWEWGNNSVISGEGHSHHITDVRFRPYSTVFATSSLDRTVKIWDAAKPSNPIQDLVEHAGQVMSIDFHPTKTGLLSSCDINDEIRLWDVNRGDCGLILKGGSSQVRFQPRHGDLLASSTGSTINIFDLKTNNIQKQLQGHVKDVRSICWEFSGRYLASVCEDSARIWSVSEGKCIFEQFSCGNKFQSCTFRPRYSQVVVIGSDEFLELWNPILKTNTTLPYSAHAGIIPSLADSHAKSIVASVSHDQSIKIWR